jgi:hypothetical protein
MHPDVGAHVRDRQRGGIRREDRLWRNLAELLEDPLLHLELHGWKRQRANSPEQLVSRATARDRLLPRPDARELVDSAPAAKMNGLPVTTSAAQSADSSSSVNTAPESIAPSSDVRRGRSRASPGGSLRRQEREAFSHSNAAPMPSPMQSAVSP